MADFNLNLFLQCNIYSFFKSKNTPGRLTVKRFFKLIFIYFQYFSVQIASAIGFLFDDLFFRGYKTQEINQPFFIIGNFRCGSTHLQRLLSLDPDNFLPIKSWEIFLSHSVSFRKLIFTFLKIDTFFGSPLQRLEAAIEKKVFAPITIHPIGLRYPEEDESFNIYTFRTMFLLFMFPFVELFKPYFYFDQAISADEKTGIFCYYRNMLQRHLFAHGGKGHILSKNPCFTPKVDSIYHEFPDARIILLVRDPVEHLPACNKLISYFIHYFSDPAEPYPHLDFLCETYHYALYHALERLDSEDPTKYLIIRYDDLVSDLEGTIHRLYQHFGLPLSADFEKILQFEAEKSRRHQPTSTGELEHQGLDAKRIAMEYQDIIKRFNFQSKNYL